MSRITTTFRPDVGLILLLAIACLSVAAVGCRGSDERQPSTGSVVSVPTADSTQNGHDVIRATSTPASGGQTPTSPPETPTARPMPVPIDGLPPSEVRFNGRCISNFEHSIGLKGTAPGPTATPVAVGQQASRADIEKAFVRASAISESLEFWSDWFRFSWGHAETAEQRAFLVNHMGTTVARLCSAYSTVRPPSEISEFSDSLTISLDAHHELLIESLSELLCCADIVATDVSGMVESLNNRAKQVADIRDRVGKDLDLENLPEIALIPDQEMGFSVELPVGWVLDRDTNFFVSVAPPSLQRWNDGGLGPDWWGLGTAVKSRRLRNPTELTSDEARSKFSNLVDSFGVVQRETSSEISDFPAVELTLVDGNTNWRTEVVIVVAGRHTFVLAAGCPSGFADGCSAGLDIIRSFEFSL